MFKVLYHRASIKGGAQVCFCFYKVQISPALSENSVIQNFKCNQNTCQNNIISEIDFINKQMLHYYGASLVEQCWFYT